MVLTIQPQVFPAVARPAAEALPLRPGQMLEAVVLGKTPDGLVALKIGEVVVSAQLPQTLPAGTTLQLQVKGGGASPQLVMVGTSTLPATVAQTVPALPLPPTPMQSVPSVTTVSASLAAAPAPPSAGVPTTPPVAATVGGANSPQPPTGAVAAPLQLAAAIAATPSQAPAAPLPKASPAGAELPGSAMLVTPQATIQAASAKPIVESVQSPATPSGPGVSTSPSAPTAALPALGTTPSLTALSGTRTPLPGAQTPLPAASGTSGPSVNASVATTAPATGQTATVTAVPVAPATQHTAAAPVPPATTTPTPQSLAQPMPLQVASIATPVPATTSAQPLPTPAAVPTPAVPTTAVAIEPASPSPLLVAQGAVRQPATMADMPKTSAPVAAASPRAVSAPASPVAALAQMVPEAMARQNSVAPLLASLAAVIGKPGALPEPVLRAALQVLGSRLQVSASGPTAEQISAAVAKSGLYLEAALAKGTPQTSDLKSGLVALKGALAAFLGGNPAPVGAAQQAPPPLRGMPPRAEPLDLPSLPDAPREAARTLHGQTDAALSRVKLMQFASLPDADPARPLPSELRMELPFLIGHELVMAQFQVTRDSARRQSEGKRGWTMRFAMNFASAGEVGAEVGLLGRSVNVALWAADPDTAADLEVALPQLAPALAALGLEPGAVRVRPLPPEPPPAASGQYLDSRR